MAHRHAGLAPFLLGFAIPLPGLAADHLDAPILNPPRLNADINDLYVFTGADASSTVLAGTYSPAAGAIGPSTFGTDVIYQFNIVDLPRASPFDLSTDIAYRAIFDPPDAAGIQSFKLYKATGPGANGHSVNSANQIFSGSTGRNYDLPTGGKFFAGLRGDPFFFDLAAFQGGFGEAGNGRGFNDGNEVDFFEDLNVLALVLEIPDSQLPAQTSSAGSSFGVWASTGDLSSGVQLDRKGRPAVNTVVNSTGTLIGAPSSNKDLYNTFQPSSDTAFQQAVKDALEILSGLDSEGAFNSTQLDMLANILLPDILPFSKNDGVLGPPLNGRRLEDDVIDIELNLLTGGDPLGLFSGRDANGGIRTDGIGPHDDYLNVFPYLATPTGPAALGGEWTDTPVFNEQPLEAKLGTLTDGLNPTAQGFIIWNSSPGQNVLTGITIPPPYDGTGVTTQTIGSPGGLFALGDVCTNGTDAVVAYIRDFKPLVTRYDSSGPGAPNITTQALNVPPTDFYDSADCGVTADGIFVSTHNDIANEIELYRSTDGGQTYTFYGRYADSVSGPFSAGALRDQLVTNRNGSQAAGLYQRPDGAIRVTTFDTSQNPPVFNSDTVLSASPPAGFMFVKESGGTSLSRQGTSASFYFTYNFDGAARVTEIPVSDPTTQTNRNLGTVNNGGGSDYGFSGGTIVGQPNQTNVIWGDWFLLDENGDFAGLDSEYPNIGVGGPVDGCFVEDIVKPGFTGTYYLTGRTDTRLLRREDPPVPIFEDGFESGDTSSWACD